MLIKFLILDFSQELSAGMIYSIQANVNDYFWNFQKYKHFKHSNTIFLSFCALAVNTFLFA